MKNRYFFCILFFAITFLGSQFILSITYKQPNLPSKSLETDTLARIHRIETGLFPLRSENSQPSQPVNLIEHMKEHDVPGVSIAIINNHRLEWARGYGVQETGSNQPVTTQTFFQAASISKPVSALAALNLVEQGKFGLNQNVNEKLRCWKVPDNRFTKTNKVTLQGILTHTAGLTTHGFFGYRPDADLPTLGQMLDGDSPATSQAIRVNTVPSSNWSYSGGGFLVLQQLAMDNTGKPFPELMQQIVLEKLDMKNSTFHQPLPSELLSKAASGHIVDGEVLSGKWRVHPEMAPAGLWTTPSDLALFAIELQNSRAGVSNKVISQSMANQMLTPGMNNWGLGLPIIGEGKKAMFLHGGGNQGFRCLMIGYLETGQGAVVMTNSDYGFDLIIEIINSIAKEYKWPSSPFQEDPNNILLNLEQCN